MMNTDANANKNADKNTHAKTFIVTGAASGIGLALTRRLLADGHRVCACDINETALQQHFAEHLTRSSLLIQKLDIRQSNAWQATVARVLSDWQHIDVLCNVAGVLRDNWVADSGAEDIDLHFDINVKGTILGCQAVIPTMRARGVGHIINLASLAALSPVPGLSLYSASKYAVRAYSLAAAMELKADGIAVTAVCPDAVQTPMLDQQKGKTQTALTFSGGRTLSVDEVVDAIVHEVLDKKPMELILPLQRGVVAKIANVFPTTAGRVIGIMRRQGLKRQRQH